MIGYIYVIESNIKGIVYVGKTENANVRKNVHFNQLKHNTHSNIKLQRHYNKYGKQDLSFRTYIEKEYESESQLLEEENRIIQEIGESFELYNFVGNYKNSERISLSDGDILIILSLYDKYPDSSIAICRTFGIPPSLLSYYNKWKSRNPIYISHSKEDRDKIAEDFFDQNEIFPSILNTTHYSNKRKHDNDIILNAICLMHYAKFTPKEVSNVLGIKMNLAQRLEKKHTYEDVHKEYEEHQDKFELLNETINKYEILDKKLSCAQIFTSRDVFKILDLLKNGMSEEKIAKCFGVARGSIQKIRNRITYETQRRLYDLFKSMGVHYSDILN